MTLAARSPRPSHEETRTAILRTARELFSEYGVAKTTLGDIAEALHRTKTFVYHYFESKTDMLRSLIEMEGDEYIKELEASISGVSGARQLLRVYLFTRFRVLRRLGTLYRAMREHYFEQYAFIEQAREKYGAFETRAVARILSSGIESGEVRAVDPALVTHAILIVLKGFEIEWATTEEDAFEENIDAWISILFDGIGTSGSTPETDQELGNSKSGSS
jgi:AcrR family transcriptional regulator